MTLKLYRQEERRLDVKGVLTCFLSASTSCLSTFAVYSPLACHGHVVRASPSKLEHMPQSQLLTDHSPDVCETDGDEPRPVVSSDYGRALLLECN